MEYLWVVVLIVLPTYIVGQTPSIPTCAETKCHPDAVCVDHDGFVTCDCTNGKIGINCSFDDPCVDNTGKPDCPAGMKCFGPCNPNVFCTGIPSTGIPQCYGCMEGWTGEICNQDVDECKEMAAAGETVCGQNGVCENTPGSYKCRCNTGWTGQSCNCAKGSQCDPDKDGSTGTGAAIYASGVAVFLTSYAVLRSTKYL